MEAARGSFQSLGRSWVACWARLSTTSASAAFCGRSSTCLKPSDDLEYHGASLALLQLARFAESDHHIQSVETIEVLTEQIGAMRARLQAVDGYLFAFELTPDHIGRIELNGCDRIIVAPLGGCNQITVRSLVDVVTSLVAFRLAYELCVVEQIFGAHVLLFLFWEASNAVLSQAKSEQAVSPLQGSR